MVLLSLRREEQGKVGLRYGPTKFSYRREGKVGLRYGPTKSTLRRVG